jgi:hypothetical protein
MWQFALPALKAVGINAGMNLIRRKPLFENAGTAAVTGGVLGAFNPAGSSANGVSGVGSAPSGVSGVGSAPSGAGSVGGIPSAGAFESSMGLDKAYNAGSAAGLPGSGTIESVMGSANAAGTFTNPDYFANILGNQVYTGNEGLLSQIGTGAGSLFDMAQAELPELPEITPQNLLGVSSILSNMANTPRPVASNMGGNQITGTPPKFEPFQTGQVYTRKRGNR